MKKYKQFSLTGYGYVQDLDLTEEVSTLRIQVASWSPDASESLQDQIIIHCTASLRLKKRLQMLDRQYPVSEGVTAWFQVRYCGVARYQAKAVSPGASDILWLKGELLAIENWLRDGSHSF